MKLRSWLVCLVLGLFSLFLVSSVGAKISPSPTPTTAMSSFELFWPISAGRTMGDSFYSLKSLKEKIRGFLIFGKAQKADYDIFLTVKRTVEAEKLLGEGKNDLASRTLDVAIAEVEEVGSNASRAASLKSVVDGINNRLDNLEKFLPWLAEKYPAGVEKLNQLLTSVKSLNEKI